VNPSPNAPNLWMARCYPGTVMLEGTTLSEGRGTTRPLELFGAPDIDVTALVAEMQRLAPEWLHGCRLRTCWFERRSTSTSGSCAQAAVPRRGWQLRPPRRSRPWRAQALAFKALRRLRPEYDLWRDFPYEYERGRLAIDLINGSELLRRG